MYCLSPLNMRLVLGWHPPLNHIELYIHLTTMNDPHSSIAIINNGTSSYPQLLLHFTKPYPLFPHIYSPSSSRVEQCETCYSENPWWPATYSKWLHRPMINEQKRVYHVCSRPRISSSIAPVVLLLSAPFALEFHRRSCANMANSLLLHIRTHINFLEGAYLCFFA